MRLSQVLNQKANYTQLVKEILKGVSKEAKKDTKLLKPTLDKYAPPKSKLATKYYSPASLDSPSLLQSPALQPNSPLDVPSNVLFVSSENPFLVHFDFIVGKIRNFDMYKARAMPTLQFDKGYFLVFHQLSLAQKYFAEAKKGFIDGVPVRIEFVDPSSVPGNFAHSILGESVSVTDKLIEVNQSENEADKFDEKYVDKSLTKYTRSNYAAVHHLPYNFSVSRIIDTHFWRFDLAPKEPVKVLFDDPYHKYKVHLIKFCNTEDPLRYFRLYNGRYLNFNRLYPRTFVDVLD